MERPKTTIPFSFQDSFVFRQRSGEINWREIQNIDIDFLIQSGNISKINELLENLTFSNIDTSDLQRFPDTFVLKFIRLSQFALEYLQQQKSQLESENEGIKKEKSLQLHLNSELESKITNFNKKNTFLANQIKNKKRVLSLFEQYVLKQPSMMEVLQRIDRNKHIKCSTCGKIFENFQYYEMHRKRRHEAPSRPPTAPLAELQGLKLSLEDQLKQIQSHHEEEITQLKSLILHQTQSKIKEPLVEAPKAELSKSVQEIESLKKELLEIRAKKKRQEEIIQDRQAEILRLELENKKLLKSKEKLKVDMEKVKFGDSQKIKSSAREEDNSIEDPGHRRRKITSESGMTNFVNNIYDGLVDRQGPFDHKDEEKRGRFTPFSERMSPSFKENDENEYVMPIEAPEPNNILKAAQFLGIDPVEETQFLYLAREFLKNPIPDGWEVVKNGENHEFLNKDNGQTQIQHPGIEFFRDLYRQIKNKKAFTLDKLKAIVNRPVKGILTLKYREGLMTYFAPDENIFYTQRLMLNEKVQTALDKMKNISTVQLNKINEEREKMFMERGEEYRRANEVLNSELIKNFNKLKK
jgi:hypothetical protein